MRHQKPYRKLSRQRSHYRALMRNLALSVFEHERIETTLIKAKEVRPFIDRIITLGKDGTLHARRRAFSLMGNISGVDSEGNKLDIVGKVFKDISGRFKDRKGGYTRITRLGHRPGDAAPMAILELVDTTKPAEKKQKAEEKRAKRAAAAEKEAREAEEAAAANS